MALVPIHRANKNSLSRLHNEMDDLFDSFFRGLERPFSGYKAWPAIDVADENIKPARQLTNFVVGGIIQRYR